ncbi:ribonuclease domain-containing protein [Streptomyces sp. FXJ1.172]|uniref:ribonuclease domain-containing protein n=1 Tax=Streptomyces sp. FXJ1.172 TaxID=710705 RepID=UPI00099F9CA3|nr:ribonuclease domain-containing protein [Streptomyces sp. FXJ1.172]WEO98593.1 ribonuclease domain-containing protein [Streptomyces sp. FXJ1.172]
MLSRFGPHMPRVPRSLPRALAGLLAVVLAVLLAGCSSGPQARSGAGTGSGTEPAASAPAWAHGMGTVRESQLPAEARRTLALIDKGGPFPYAKDGVVFGNFEGHLPGRPRGYYHEYTVRTPGSRDRGARRIVTGRGGEIYYTDDHYNSFRAVLR